ncbi:hypothetical protein [Tabrizicola sp.]|uniref:hypothetical protein n=1 Tax=Tabrizicola sp. TaxID=2005166 RepID=UPI00286ACC7A|nr:hypothetical protein [Tabrizicola sp.]
MAVERQRTLEEGAEAAARSLTHFFPRSLSGMVAMEQVEVDFREFKALCIWPDGYIGCPWVGLAGDRASSKIVGRTIQKSETAEDRRHRRDDPGCGLCRSDRDDRALCQPR